MNPIHGSTSGHLFNQRLHLVSQENNAYDVRFYKNFLIGLFMRFVGKAIKLEVKGKVFYVNKNSLSERSIIALCGQSDLRLACLRKVALEILAPKNVIKFDTFNQKIHDEFIKICEQDSVLRINPKTVEPIPVASNEKDCPHGFFVEILNSGKYSINGKVIQFPLASKPVLVTFNSNEVVNLKTSQLLAKKIVKIEQEVQDMSTEQAINVRNDHAKIALNFANEECVGGPVPGFHKDPTSGKFVYDTKSATTQEESLSQRTDLMASLTQLPHDLEGNVYSKMITSYYLNPENLNERKAFDSRKVAYVSDNHLFAVQSLRKNNFFVSHYLEDSAQPVSFVTSAATYYGDRNQIDCNPDSSDKSVGGLTVYEDAFQRIQTHLFAAATKAAEIQKKDPHQKIELILGAYGCGVFAPKGNANDYRHMIAGIYRDLVPKFEGFFDLVTYAVPTFNSPKGSANELNYHIFKQVLEKA